MKQSIGERSFAVFNVFLLIAITSLVVMPLMHIFAISISNNYAVTSMSVGLLPVGTNFAAYKELLTKQLFQNSLRNSVFLTVSYTFLALSINTLSAFGFSKPFFGKKIIMYLFVITMYFGGGLIPSYMLMTNTLNLYNNYLAYILPGLVSVFYMIVIRSQIEALPPSLSEAAQIDGATEAKLLFYIILPSIKSTLAAIAMFLALGMWNMWYSVLLYTNKTEMWTLQYMLRAIVFEKLAESRYGGSTNAQGAAVNLDETSPYNYQMAAIIAVAAPIVCIYPFVQKYFVKGILVGAVKE